MWDNGTRHVVSKVARALVLLGVLAVFNECFIGSVSADSQPTGGTLPGTVWAWGRNSYGELGTNTNQQCFLYENIPCSTIPVQTSGATSIVAIAGGSSHSIALDTDGSVWTWGINLSGELGNGMADDIPHATPLQVPNLASVVAIAAGSDYNLALKTDGTVWAWGGNDDNQLGDPRMLPNDALPVQVAGLTGIVAIAAGAFHNLALKSDGTVWAWGANFYGQLGGGFHCDSTTPATFYATCALARPIKVGNLANVVAIAAGANHSLAVKADGTVWAWGRNLYGQLGNGTTADAMTPVQVSGLFGVTAVAAGDYADHSLALKSDGTVWAWGDDAVGELGVGTAVEGCGYLYPPTACSTIPVQVPSLSNITAIAGAQYHSMALASNGTVWAWGEDSYGESGAATTNRCYDYQAFFCDRLPVEVPNLSNVVAIGSGADHNLAVVATSGGSGPGEGTDTPELPSAELLTTGLLPIGGAVLYRRRASRRRHSRS